MMLTLFSSQHLLRLVWNVIETEQYQGKCLNSDKTD